jgi:hypothetical protein
MHFPTRDLVLASQRGWRGLVSRGLGWWELCDVGDVEKLEEIWERRRRRNGIVEERRKRD